MRKQLEVSQLVGCVDDVLRRIQGSLLGDALGEDGGLGDVKLQASIFLSQLGLDVTIIRISNRPGLMEL